MPVTASIITNMKLHLPKTLLRTKELEELWKSREFLPILSLEKTKC